MKIINLKEKLVNLAPVIGLLVVTAVFAILTRGKTLSSVNMKILSNQIIVTALVAIGAVFCFSCRALDMSLAGSLCLTSIAGALVGLKTDSAVAMMMTMLVVSMMVAFLKGVAAAYMTLPVFIVTIIFGNLLSAVGLVLLGTQTTLQLGSIITITDMTVINVVVLGGFYLFALIIFSYTQIGKANKLVGGNPVAAEQSGISRKKSCIFSFLISGLGVTLAAIIMILRTKTVTSATGTGIGQDVLVAVVLGGMPLSGGPRSKISAGLIGAATITILNNGLSVCGVGTDVVQIVRGIVFLIVVFISSMGYRTKLLPR